MKHQIILIACCFAMLPIHAQAQSSGTKASRQTGAVPPESTTYVREGSGTVCTTAPRADWLPEDEMRLLAEHRGYRIKTFKVANNSCYEVYGFDRTGQIVEAYFNPVTARLVRQNIAR
jgi:hypothetical protein